MSYVHIATVSTEKTAVNICENIGCDYEEISPAEFHVLGSQAQKEQYDRYYGWRSRLEFTVSNFKHNKK